MENRSSNLLMGILGVMIITLASIFFTFNKDKFMSDSTVKMSGVVDRIGAYGGTVFLLKDMKTSFYVDNNKDAALTKPGDRVEFTVTNMDKKIRAEERIDHNSFVNLTLNQK